MTFGARKTVVKFLTKKFNNIWVLSQDKDVRLSMACAVTLSPLANAPPAR
jgi:hypothetical protein